MIVTQPSVTKSSNHGKIPRILKNDMTKPIEYEVEIQRYHGPKQPEMPAKDAKTNVLSLRILAQQVNSITNKL